MDDNTKVIGITLVIDLSRILVFVLIGTANFRRGFRFVDDNCRIFVNVVVILTKTNLFWSTLVFVIVFDDEKH